MRSGARPRRPPGGSGCARTASCRRDNPSTAGGVRRAGSGSRPIISDRAFKARLAQRDGGLGAAVAGTDDHDVHFAHRLCHSPTMRPRSTAQRCSRLRAWLAIWASIAGATGTAPCASADHRAELADRAAHGALAHSAIAAAGVLLHPLRFEIGAQQVEPHLLEIACKARHQQPLPRIGRHHHQALFCAQSSPSRAPRSVNAWRAGFRGRDVRVADRGQLVPARPTAPSMSNRWATIAA